MKRLPNKEYDELLKIMRRWPDPYRAMVAKLIHHISFQFNEISRLERRIRELEQLKFFKEKEEIKKKKEEPIRELPKPEKWPLGRRLWHLKDNGLIGGEEWLRILKWNRITEKEAARLIEEYELEAQGLN